MATLVFRSSTSGSLQQVQVGAADIVATLKAAQSAWGWIGGLASIQRLISGLKETIHKDPFKSLRLSPKLTLPSSRCHILTGIGMFYFEDEDGHKAFGGDPITQTIGLTICALAHECSGEVAVDLFVKFIAEHYIQGPNKVPGLVESLYQLLMDHITAIVNEGATRGLRERFANAAANLPEAAKLWQYSPDYSGPYPNRLQNFEISLVGGLLEWLTGYATKGTDPYFTRSSLAVRTASYLKAVGYDIGPIVVWDGQGPVPQPRPRGVVLVLGGVSESDFCQTSNVRIPDTVARGATNVNLYFRRETIGSMLLNALGIHTSIRVETVQTMFEDVQSCVKRSVTCNWEAPESAKQCLTAVFKKSQTWECSKALPVRIASMYFTLSADILASCYDRISTESLLECVQRDKFQFLDRVSSTDLDDLVRFRIITASIVISVVDLLSKAFGTSYHVTQMYLGSSLWLDEVCGHLDKHFTSGLDFHDAAIIVGTLHSAAPSRLLDMEGIERSSILGFRHGSLAVLPALLVDMVPTEDCIGISCLDQFIANIPVFPDGSVRGTTDTGPNWSPPGDQNPPDFSWQSLQQPRDEAPNLSLYLGIERPILSRQPFLVLGARIGGSITGYSSVRTAMWVVAKSLGLSSNCSGHPKPGLAIKLDASHWALLGENWSERLDGPLTKTHCIFLPTLGSAAWALHLAGQNYRVVISYDCFDCATVGEPSKDYVPLLVVGYGPRSNPRLAIGS